MSDRTTVYCEHISILRTPLHSSPVCLNAVGSRFNIQPPFSFVCLFVWFLLHAGSDCHFLSSERVWPTNQLLNRTSNVSIFFLLFSFFSCLFFLFFSVVFNATMSSLPGTVPRMMRPAPGQNYPRTGFPLEGRSLTVALNNLSDSGRFFAEAEKNASLIWRLFKQIFCIKH